MDDPLGRSIVIVICFFIAAVFSLFIGAVQTGDPPEKNSALKKKLQTPDRMLLGFQGIRLMCLMTAAVEGAMLFPRRPGVFVLTSLALAFLAVPLCVVVPLSIARARADRILNRYGGLIVFLSGILTPFSALCQGLVKPASRLFGVDPAFREEITEEEIKAIVDIGEESGAIEQSEHELIRNVFDFADLTAADCMTHRTDVTALQINDSAEEILDTIRESGLSRFPVYGKDIDDVIGVLATRDFLLNARSAHPKSLRQLLREPYFVPETVKTDVLLHNMQLAKTHLAIVVDEYGGMSGIVTMEDLLEEIVGNIYDEFDPQDEAEIVPIGPDTWQVSGTADLGVLSEEMGVTLPGQEDYDTVGGLIFSRFTEIPAAGATPEVVFECVPDGDDEEEDGNAARDTVVMKVLKIVDRRVEKALVTLKRPEKPQEETGGKNHEPDRSRKEAADNGKDRPAGRG